MNNRRVFIYVCGILTTPGASRNWTGRAVTYTHVQGAKRGQSWYAEKIEYQSDAVFKFMAQAKRVQKLALTLDYYLDWPITLVGHSNGTDVIVRCLRENPSLKVDKVHLVSAATGGDFIRNGMNLLLTNGSVGECTVYVNGKDSALRLAASFLGKSLGYGALGITGPDNVWPGVHGKVHVVRDFPFSSYGHSTMWEDERFDQTMERFF